MDPTLLQKLGTLLYFLPFILKFSNEYMLQQHKCFHRTYKHNTVDIEIENSNAHKNIQDWNNISSIITNRHERKCA